MSHLAASSTSIALVTGAAQGIGKAIALRLAEDGLDVVINDIASNEPKLNEVVNELREKGRRAFSVIADVSKEAEVEEMVKKVVNNFGRLDVVSICISSFFTLR